MKPTGSVPGTVGVPCSCTPPRSSTAQPRCCSSGACRGHARVATRTRAGHRHRIAAPAALARAGGRASLPPAAGDVRCMGGRVRAQGRCSTHESRLRPRTRGHRALSRTAGVRRPQRVAVHGSARGERPVGRARTLAMIDPKPYVGDPPTTRCSTSSTASSVWRPIPARSSAAWRICSSSISSACCCGCRPLCARRPRLAGACPSVSTSYRSGLIAARGIAAGGRLVRSSDSTSGTGRTNTGTERQWPNVRRLNRRVRAARRARPWRDTGGARDPLCASHANTWVRFHGVDMPVCGIHARTYLRWGSEAARNAVALWGWPDADQVQFQERRHRERRHLDRRAGVDRRKTTKR